MGHATDTSAAAYCRKCDYALTGLPEKHQCPECGQAFDLSDRRTFRRRPRRRWWRTARWFVYPLSILVLLTAGGPGYVWWQWRSEQDTIRWVRTRSGDIHLRVTGPEWVQKRAGQWRWMLQRADVVAVGVTPGLRPEEVGISRLKHIRTAVFLSDGVTVRWVAELAAMKELTTVHVEGWQLGDKSDESLQIVGNLKEMDWLHLAGFQGATPAGWKALAKAPKLQVVWLEDCALDDAGLAELQALPKLRHIRVKGAKLSDAALAKLRQAKPGIAIYID